MLKIHANLTDVVFIKNSSEVQIEVMVGISEHLGGGGGGGGGGGEERS